MDTDAEDGTPGRGRRGRRLLRPRFRPQPDQHIAFRCCCCCCSTVAVLAVVAGIAFLIFYLVARPGPPALWVSAARANSLDVTPAGALNATFDVALRAENPSRGVGVGFNAFEVSVWSAGEKLAYAAEPAFELPGRTSTEVTGKAAARGLRLLDAAARELRRGREVGQWSVEVRARATVRFRVGAVRSWGYQLRAICSPVTMSSAAAASPPPATAVKCRVRVV